MEVPDGLYERLTCSGCGALLGLVLTSGRKPPVIWCPKCYGLWEEGRP